MKKVIIFHISDFGGHSKAAENIKEALLYRRQDLSALNINGFGYFYPHAEKLTDFLYAFIIKKYPQFWGRIYDRKKIIKNLSPLQKSINKHAFNKLSSLIKDFSPDCFVATQAFPCGIVGDFKQNYGVVTPLVAIVTDYYPHRFWIHPLVDKYVVACQKAKEILIKEGVSPGKIEILGIPISIKFIDCCQRKKIAEELGFYENLDTVLIMGGGWGIGPLENIAKKLDDCSHNFQIIIVCGQNKKLYDWFDKNKHNFRKPLFYFGYIDFIYKLMGFADIIITKGGGITISEALAKGLAIVTVKSIPGQEERNVNYLLEENAIIKADETANIIDCINSLLSDRSKLERLRNRAREISSVDSSLKIADLILGLINS
jgi:processive 1,2-diacylglycerol beta-glucosyltransferase